MSHLPGQTTALTPAQFAAAMNALLASLLTTLPSTSGVLWLDGKTLAVS